MKASSVKLDPISAFLKKNLPNYISVEMFYVIATCFVVLMCGLLIYSMLKPKKSAISSRIKAIHDRRKEMFVAEVGAKKRKKPEKSVNFMKKVSMKLELVKKLHLEQVESLLVQAGYRSKDAISVFAFMTVTLPFVFGVMAFIRMQLNNSITTNDKLIDGLFLLGGIYIGFKLPLFIVRRTRKKRYIAIQRGSSDTLDLLTVCAEAGLSIPAGMDRVSKELGTAYPEMAEELALTSLEIGFYPDRNKAFNNLAERCDLKEIRGIVTVLIQTEKYGTPVAQALRVLSSEFRIERMLRAENKAAKLPAIMTLPLALFILPTLFIIILTPAVITAKKNFAGSSLGATNASSATSPNKK